MILTPPSSTELKGNPETSPTTDLRLPEPILCVKKPSRKAPRRNHSEIERRRRERLNFKYNELRELVPACRAFRFARRGGDAGLHKLDILTEAVKYIEELQELLSKSPVAPPVPVPVQHPPHQSPRQHSQQNMHMPMHLMEPLDSLVQAATEALQNENENRNPPRVQESDQGKHHISFLVN